MDHLVRPPLASRPLALALALALTGLHLTSLTLTLPVSPHLELSLPRPSQGKRAIPPPSSPWNLLNLVRRLRANIGVETTSFAFLLLLRIHLPSTSLWFASFDFRPSDPVACGLCPSSSRAISLPEPSSTAVIHTLSLNPCRDRQASSPASNSRPRGAQPFDILPTDLLVSISCSASPGNRPSALLVPPAESVIGRLTC